MNTLINAARRRVHPKSFLKRVDLHITLNNSITDDASPALAKRKRGFFSRNFGYVNTANSLETVSIANKDKTLLMVFAKDYIHIQAIGTRYKSFSDTIFPILYNVVKYLDQVLRYHGNLTVDIRKINMWKITPKKTEDPMDYNTLKKLVFSTDFLSVLAPIANEEDREEFNEGFKNAELHMVTTLINAAESEDNPSKYLVLDINSQRTASTTTLFPAIVRANDRTYDAFAWAIKRDILNVLD